MPGATQISLYNGACSAIGTRQLMTLTENQESRRALDDIWTRGGVRTCLADAQWNFAIRSAQWNYSPDFTPPFGYQCVYEMPGDWVRAAAFCQDEYFAVPLIRYKEESGFVYADLQTIYAAWVSDDPAFGMNLAKWPDNFQRYAELYFASMVVRRLTNSDATEKKVNDQLKVARAKAKGTDAMEEATMFLPPGTWSQARHGRRTGNDMGSRSQLIG